MEKLYYADTFHHVYNRGTLRTEIFFDDEDYHYFLDRLRKFRLRYEIKIICYCLLPNHFHLFVKQTKDNFTIGRFVGDLQNGHTKFINKKYCRTGVVFEGPAKSKFISESDYYKWLIDYIVQNPVKAKLVSKAEEWKYSTASEVAVQDKEGISDVDELIKIYGSPEKFKDSFSVVNLNDNIDTSIFY